MTTASLFQRPIPSRLMHLVASARRWLRAWQQAQLDAGGSTFQRALDPCTGRPRAPGTPLHRYY